MVTITVEKYFGKLQFPMKEMQGVSNSHSGSQPSIELRWCAGGPPGRIITEGFPERLVYGNTEMRGAHDVCQPAVFIRQLLTYLFIGLFLFLHFINGLGRIHLDHPHQIYCRGHDLTQTFLVKQHRLSNSTITEGQGLVLALSLLPILFPIVKVRPEFSQASANE